MCCLRSLVCWFSVVTFLLGLRNCKLYDIFVSVFRRNFGPCALSSWRLYQLYRVPCVRTLSLHFVVPGVCLFSVVVFCDSHQGGGECGVDNLRTLCVLCHAEVTRVQTIERAAARRLDKENKRR